MTTYLASVSGLSCLFI